jgi:sugar lactone lactonase YvrE
MEHGSIHRAAADDAETTEFITRDTTNNLASVIGMYAHTATNRLYVCSSETTAMGTPSSPASLKAFNLTTGAFIASWAWPTAPGTKHTGTTAEGFCNDITVSADGYTVFATDSWYPRIVRVAGAGAAPVASDALTSWYTSTLFPQDQWHLNGLDLTPTGSAIYVVENHPGGLWRVPINSVSGAGETAVPITTSRPIRGPDGLKMIDADTIAIAESTGGMALIDITGNTGAVRTVSTGLDGASGPQGPDANKPFRLVEVPLGL